ncbi:hypothetical protein MCEMSHM24_01859 [Comamonadaceae bacterium]
MTWALLARSTPLEFAPVLIASCAYSIWARCRIGFYLRGDVSCLDASIAPLQVARYWRDSTKSHDLFPMSFIDVPQSAYEHSCK